MAMEIAVIGAGALGTVFGGLLSDEGHDVRLLHYDAEFVDRINADGVQIYSDYLDGAPYHLDVAATTDASTVGSVDLALVFVKTPQTREALQQHAACLGDHTRVLSLQNGLRNYEKLAEFVAEERILVGITYEGGELRESGVVDHERGGPSIFGGQDNAFARRVGDAFEAANLKAEVVDDPFPAIWEKLVWAAVSKPISVLTRLPFHCLATDDNLVRVMENVVEETYEVAEARGVKIQTERDEILEEIIETLENRYSYDSNLKDVRAEQRTEIADVNGAIVEYADQEGVDVTYNRVLTSLVEGLERSFEV